MGLLMAGQRKKISIIGAGWYGCHLALALQKQGYDVTLFEKNSQIMNGVSGTFGIRLHSGLHYPRSEKTRENCRTGFAQFKKEYPELVVEHEHSIYGLGIKDADNKPSKVSPEDFLKVAQELNGIFDWKVVKPDSIGLDELYTAIDLNEPSVVLGEPLRDAFTKRLAAAGVKVVCNHEVIDIKKNENGFLVHSKDSAGVHEESFDTVINSTGYQSNIPSNEDFPFDMQVVYQPCLALVYEDTQAGEKPFSFIVMDGWFPCMMPVCDKETPDIKSRDYILTHGKWTILGSYDTPEEAKADLAKVDDEFIKHYIRTPSEYEMGRYFPEFVDGDRFKFKGWKGEVLAKLRTRKEFRSGFTYSKDGIIQVFPGKISNVFDVEEEVLALLNNDHILTQGSYSYVEGGVMHNSRRELEDKPFEFEPNTGNLQTFRKLLEEHARCNQKYQTTLITDPNANYFFEMQCLNRFFAGSALLGTALVILLYTGSMIVLPVAVPAVLMMGYSVYSFFTHNNTSGIAPDKLETTPGCSVDGDKLTLQCNSCN